MYAKRIDKECVIIALYVNDMLIFGTSLDVVHNAKKILDHSLT